MIMGKHSLMIKIISNDYKGPTWAFFFLLRENYLSYYEKRNEYENDKTPDGESHIRYDNAHESTWYLRENYIF